MDLDVDVSTLLSRLWGGEPVERPLRTRRAVLSTAPCDFRRFRETSVPSGNPRLVAEFGHSTTAPW